MEVYSHDNYYEDCCPIKNGFTDARRRSYALID